MTKKQNKKQTDRQAGRQAGRQTDRPIQNTVPVIKEPSTRMQETKMLAARMPTWFIMARMPSVITMPHNCCNRTAHDAQANG